jgi:hypothetical protein
VYGKVRDNPQSPQVNLLPPTLIGVTRAVKLTDAVDGVVPREQPPAKERKIEPAVRRVLDPP